MRFGFRISSFAQALLIALALAFLARTANVTAAETLDGRWVAVNSCTAARANPQMFPAFSAPFFLDVISGRVSGSYPTRQNGSDRFSGTMATGEIKIVSHGAFGGQPKDLDWDTEYRVKKASKNNIVLTGSMIRYVVAAGRRIPVRDCILTLTRDDIVEPAQADLKKPNEALSKQNLEEEPSSSLDRGHRVALVIGNSAYQSVAPLNNPSHDADAISEALKSQGFANVTVLKNQTRTDMAEAFRAFSKEAQNADWALVYYAGHGIEVGGSNYLIPVDATLKSDADIGFETIALDQVLASIEPATKLKLVMLDACRDNPFVRGMKISNPTRSIGHGLARLEPEPGTLVVFAARHGQIAYDGKTTSSPFASAFLKNLAKPHVEVRELFDLVRDDVLDETDRKQMPFVYGSLSGRRRFYFR